MSLINDALRRARQESPEVDPNDPQHFGYLSPPRRRISWLGLGLALGAVMALAAVFVGVGTTMWWLSSDEDQPALAETPPESPTGFKPAETTVVLETPVSEEVPSLVPVPPPPEARISTPVPTPEEPLATAVSPELERNADTPEPEPTEPSGGRPDETSEQTPGPAHTSESVSGGERSFVAEADVGYARLILDFIVYRSTNPFAEINGIEVHEGSLIEGFVVESIEQTRVVLRDDRGPLILRTK